MRFNFPIVISVLAAGGVAAASPSEDLTSAIARTHDDGTRVAYHAAQTTIAERDLATAELELKTTRERWDAAVRADHPNAAGYWAEAHMHAQDRAKEAYKRVVAERAERDLARTEFKRDAAEAQRAQHKTRDRG